MALRCFRAREAGRGQRELICLEKAEQAARTILGDNSADLRLVAETLVLKETLTAAELQDMVRGGGGGGAVEMSS